MPGLLGLSVCSVNYRSYVWSISLSLFPTYVNFEWLIVGPKKVWKGPFCQAIYWENFTKIMSTFLSLLASFPSPLPLSSTSYSDLSSLSVGNLYIKSNLKHWWYHCARSMYLKLKDLVLSLNKGHLEEKNKEGHIIKVFIMCHPLLLPPPSKIKENKGYWGKECFWTRGNVV